MDGPSTNAPSPPSIGFDDRLLAEAARISEDLAGEAAREDEAVASAVDHVGDFERRLVVRARSLPVAPVLESALRHVRGGITLVIVFTMVLALAAGVGAARAALGGQRHEPAIFLPVLGGLLGVQSLLLLAWLIVVAARPRSLSGASLGGLVFRAAEFIARLGSHSRHSIAALQATAEVTLHRSIARWTFSAISHGLWTAFNIGCIAMLLLLLSTKRYTFAWETTILSPGAYEPLIDAIGWLPERVGFETPTAQQIEASQWTGEGDPPEEARHAWSGLLIGSMVVYGALPRIVLLVLSLIALGRAQRGYRLDTSRPGFLRLQSRLMPGATRLGIVNGEEDGGATQARAAEHEHAAAATGPPAILGLELERPETGWPPELPGMGATDLGLLDDRAQRQEALQRLRALQPRPRAVAVVCALTTTPDRGVASFLQQVREAARVPITIVLTAGQSMRRRGTTGQLQGRVDDWRRMAESTGVPAERVVELDLDHATDASLRSLASRLGGEPMPGGIPRQIERAFALIDEHVGQWPLRPSMDQRLDLHRAIGRLYRREGSSWIERAKSMAGAGSKLADQVREQATWSVTALPVRLRNTPKWAVAGASAGALGCLAMASLVAPAALAALPSWSLVGGAIASAVHAVHRLSPEDRAEPDAETIEQADRAEAVRAAALFAVLLEVQGRGEATISSVLDATFRSDDDPPEDPAQLRAWLDDVRHRLDVALAQHSSGGRGGGGGAS